MNTSVNVLDLVKKHEGLRLKPYDDSTGHLTIGYGRNLEAKGVSLEEAEHMLANDIAEVTQMLELNAWWGPLSDNRKAVLIDMTYNMGPNFLKDWPIFVHLIANGHFTEASYLMTHTRWAKQVGARAEEDAKLMRDG